MRGAFRNRWSRESSNSKPLRKAVRIMATERRRARQRGMAIFFYATMLVFVIGCVGLAVDAGTIYMIKARLSSAVDAAALAAGRSVNLANTVAQATTAATTTANQFFTANFPTGYFNSIGTPTVRSEEHTSEL